jgi:two-component system invasion response regulator UvrY
MSRKTIRVLIVDDHAIVREGYRALLAKHEGITVVGEACDAASAYQCYKDKQPDVVIMDISMPGRGGIDAIKHIREFDAHARVLVFTMHSGAAYALQAFRAGAKGYVTKSSSPDVLVDREGRFGWSSRDLPGNCSGSGFRSGATRKIAA